MKKILTALCVFSLMNVVGPRLLLAQVKSGDPAPDFTATDSYDNQITLKEFLGDYVVLEWTNPDCPFVRKHYDSGNMQKLQEKYTDLGVVWLTINSSAPGSQGHYSAQEMNAIMEERGAVPSAILLDADGKLGHLYGAQTTPHMFLINPEGRLIYQGAIDDKRSIELADVETATNYVQQVLDNALAGKPVLVDSTKSYGCSVKY